MILLEVYDVDVILEMEWLFNHRASTNCLTNKIVLSKPKYPKLEFKGDRKILPTCDLGIRG